MAEHFHLIDRLTQPPIKRAAYSDRTAWLMAVMSALSYVRFEQPTAIEELAGDLVKEANERKILQKLSALLSGRDSDALRTSLVSDLAALGFELIETYNVSIPFVVDTQAFLAKLTADGRDPILVLAFRGTEPKKPADIRSDLTANPMKIGPEDEGRMVHTGFYKGFDASQRSIRTDLEREDLKDLPLYITGHSLGGALAIVATYCLSSDRIAACYTYGCPRVGNLAFGQSIKPPVYRVINAADLVPRLPPTFAIEGLTLLLRWLPVIPYNRQIADFLEKFRHFRHYGDQRYLSAAERYEPEDKSTPASYPGLQVIANPPQVSRWFWLYRRLLATRGGAGIADHSIATYVEKLGHWGLKRTS